VDTVRVVQLTVARHIENWRVDTRAGGGIDHEREAGTAELASLRLGYGRIPDEAPRPEYRAEYAALSGVARVVEIHEPSHELRRRVVCGWRRGIRRPAGDCSNAGAVGG